MSELPIKQQLRYLKGMTEKLSVVHEAQIVQLRNYPRLIPNIKTAETIIDIDTKTIVYKCDSESKVFRKSKKVNIAFENVVNWIQTIVWDDTVVEFIVNGKSVYDTRLHREPASSN